MTTQTQNKAEQTKTNLPALRPPRLPYHPILEKEFGIDIHKWKALVEAIYPEAQTPESVRLALSYCKARNLDPFKRCIHIVPVWDAKKRCMVDTIWPGIGELRTTAHRTKSFAGRDKTEFGDIIENTWDDGEIKVTLKFPEWAQVTVYRIVNGQRVAFAGAPVYWLETFSAKKNGAPNSMWQKRPKGQLDKCAEAAALRAAFPEEIGNEYTDDEAHLQTRHVDSFEVTQEKANETIQEQAGSEQITESFEGDTLPTENATDSMQELETMPNDPPDAETQAKIEEEKKKLEGIKNKDKKNTTSKKKNKYKSEYICLACKAAGRPFEFDVPNVGGTAEAPVHFCPNTKCMSRDIAKSKDLK